MTTYAELKAAAASLPSRIADATYAGDEKALQALEVERATMPAMLFAAELRELRAELEAEHEELAEAQEEERAARATSAELMEDVKAAQQRLLLHQRETGHVMNRTIAAKQRIREIKARIEELAAAQAGYAAAAAAPMVRNMIRSHVPGPSRWPQ